MDDLVTPFAGVFRDNNIREDATLEKLATLRTAFDKTERGTLTAANSRRAGGLSRTTPVGIAGRPGARTCPQSSPT